MKFIYIKSIDNNILYSLATSSVAVQPNSTQLHKQKKKDSDSSWLKKKRLKATWPLGDVWGLCVYYGGLVWHWDLTMLQLCINLGYIFGQCYNFVFNLGHIFFICRGAGCGVCLCLAFWVGFDSHNERSLGSVIMVIDINDGIS